MSKMNKRKNVFINTTDMLNNLKNKENELDKLQNKLADWNQKAKKIQSQLNFTLPNYLIDEIIDNENTKNYLNLHSLVNCAVINGRITKENAKLIKELYC